MLKPLSLNGDMKLQSLLFLAILATAFTILLLSLRPYSKPSLRPLPPIPTSTPSPTVLKLFYFNQQIDPNTQNCTANDSVEIEIPSPDSLSPLKFAINQLIYNYFIIDQGYETRAAEFKLKSAVINNKIATLTFSDPLYYTSGGSCRVSIMKDMITKTALQFPAVSKVIILGASFQP